MSPVDLKVVLLGKEHCGKTSIVERFIYDRFRGDAAYQNTIGAAFAAKKMEVDGVPLTLGLWDTAGSERYEAMCRIYYRNAGAAIVCYDLCDVSSFDRARFWITELRKYEEKCEIYLCGTKLDLVKPDKKNRKIDYHMTTDYADEIQARGVYETSSKTGENINELFLAIARNHLLSQQSKTDRGGLESFSISNPSDRRNKCC